MFIAPHEPRFHPADFAKRLTNRSHRFLANEIEVGGTRDANNRITAKVVFKWGGAIVHDGSIPSHGFEINMAPAAGDYFLEEIDEICGALAEEGGFATPQCGAHLHIDARDFTFYDIRRLVYLYQKIEPAVFAVAAKSREGNSFCRKCGDRYVSTLAKGLMPKDNKKAVLKTIYNMDNPDKTVKAIRAHKSNETRYSALNLHSWMHRGTIECRIFQGTVDPLKLKMWGMLWAGILDFAYKAKESTVLALPSRPLDVLLETSPSDEVSAWISQRVKMRTRTIF